MHRLIKARDRAFDLASTAPRISFSVATFFVFVLSLAWGWSQPTQAQCSGGGANYCLHKYNACSALSDITYFPTGPGYTCTVGGQDRTEGYYSLVRDPNWVICTTPATLGSMSCTYTLTSCGTVKHFVSGNVNCPINNLCTGNWYWTACKGGGSAC